jgi:uncharacterized phage infection (PIP) family protein YhgE
MARKVNFANIGQSYIDGLSRGVQRYKDSISQLTESPGVAAAQAKQKWIDNLNAAQDKWANSMANLSLTSYQANALAKADRLKTGGIAAKSKVDSYFNQRGAQLQAIYDQVRALRKDPSKTGKDRSNAFQDLMKQAHGKQAD